LLELLQVRTELLPGRTEGLGVRRLPDGVAQVAVGGGADLVRVRHVRLERGVQRLQRAEFGGQCHESAPCFLCDRMGSTYLATDSRSWRAQTTHSAGPDTRGEGQEPASRAGNPPV